MLVGNLFPARAGLKRARFGDRWDQPYRAPLIPGLQEILNMSLPGLLGICLSGAGPSILAITKGNTSVIGEAIQQVLINHGVTSEVRLLAPDNKGAKGWCVPA